MFREIMAIRTSQMMTSRSLICLLENQNGGKLQKKCCVDLDRQANPFILEIVLPRPQAASGTIFLSVR
jgi:hypothetical protein